MNSDNPTLIASSSKTAIPKDPALSHALHSGLDEPLRQLHSSMESLVRKFDHGDPRSTALDSALGEVASLGRNVRDLIDYAYAPEPHPLACSINEVLYSARFQLPRRTRNRISIAHDASNNASAQALQVDGPVLSRSLARLVQAAGSQPKGGLLLRATTHADAVCFSITYHGTAVLEGDPMGLCHAIAERDLGVIGCSIEEETTTLYNTIVRIRIPTVTNTEEQAA